MKQKPKDVIDDRYRVIEKLGNGGQADVFHVQDVANDNADCALKRFHPKVIPRRAPSLARAKHEVAALTRINSPRVVRILESKLDTNNDNSSPYIVMEYARRGTLYQQDYFRGEIELSLKLFRDICEGVYAIHAAQIVHRDLKPQNILLGDNQKDVRVSDFGICFLDLEEDEERLTQFREQVGSMYFAAPEQTSLPPLFTKKSDIYSLGKILLFMITGEFKFAAGAEYISVASQVKHDLSNGVDALIKRMLSFAPQQRPAEITEIIKAIDALLGNKNGQKPGAFKPSQLQHRALKYIYSNNTPLGADIGALLSYLANFYSVDSRNTGLGTVSSPPTTSWEKFADWVEQSLDELVELGILTFRLGRYLDRRYNR